MRVETGTAAAVDTVTLRAGAVAALLGTVLYVVVSVAHGNPPITDSAATLDHVAERSWWLHAHLANVLAVVLWLVALVVVTRVLRHDRSAGLASLAAATMSVATAVYAVYFGVHGVGLTALADQWAAAEPGAEHGTVIAADAVLAVLGSTAFVAQGLLGSSVLVYGAVLAYSRALPRWLGTFGMVTGAGWLTGAVALSFAVIVPFTVLGWLWMIAIGIVLWRRANTASRG
ncbi:DUF4386 family protein [Haloechinothrix sp. LS1_15]|uniref:DUF4386 family protein n=1 Tax=Haloechinothrix sp. LS1_15 TaxID=2652248 RepID=UPI00294B48D1|nr:DUF4386 family protein [Haloechinothrix sp. LS1_15]